MPDLESLKITPEDIAAGGVTAAPDILSGSPAENKALFDRLVREYVAAAVNGALDVLIAMSVCEPFSLTKEYVPHNQVTWNGSTYQNKETCSGIWPDNTRYWLLTAERGLDGDGAGDMRAEVYDRGKRGLDVYDYAMPKKPEDAEQLLAASEDGSAEGCGLTRENIISRFLKVYNTPGQYEFEAPEDGDYIVEVVGGGGWMDSSTYSTAGGGGGYAKKLVRLTKGQQVTVTVGAAASLYSGGASSFGAHLTAAGGSYTSGGNGVGGDLNIPGGQGGHDVMLGASFLCSPGAIPNGPGRGGYYTNFAAAAGIVIISR